MGCPGRDHRQGANTIFPNKITGGNLFLKKMREGKRFFSRKKPGRQRKGIPFAHKRGGGAKFWMCGVKGNKLFFSKMIRCKEYSLSMLPSSFQVTKMAQVRTRRDEPEEDAGAGNQYTTPIKASSLKVDEYAILKEHICQIKSTETSKTGKHGGAKVHRRRSFHR